MRNFVAALLFLLAGTCSTLAKVVVFWQDGFPTVASEPITRPALAKALDGADPVFAGIDALRDPATLAGADLLVLPYGSATPADAWGAIQSYLRAGGNLLVLGGQPFRVPVTFAGGKFSQARPQDTYSRDMGINHAYELPRHAGSKFTWRLGYSFLRAPQVRARRFFGLEGRLTGLGYMVNADGIEVAAPVVVMDRGGFGPGRGGTAPGAPGAPARGAGPGAAEDVPPVAPAQPAGGAQTPSEMGPGGRGGSGSMPGSRIVMLDFEPEAGYWDSADGITLIHETAAYARQGTTSFSLEMAYSTVKPGEAPQVAVRVRTARDRGTSGRGVGGSTRALPTANAAAGEAARTPATSAPAAEVPAGKVRIELLSGNTVIDTAGLTWPDPKGIVEFAKPLAPGFYIVRGVYEEAGQPREFHQNGFWVEDQKQLASGPVLGAKGDFLTRDGKPFFPVGTNYFTTEESGWEFGGPRNAWVWERDFAEMERHGVTFVRTGVWSPTLRFIEPSTGGVTERFLRNLEAYLLSARRHNIIVNFTFYAFAPRPGTGPNGQLLLSPEVGQASTPAAGGTVRGGQASTPVIGGANSPDRQAGTPVPPTTSNPYMDPAALKAELGYVLSVVNRFKDAPWLCWDLINEPSFANPGRPWRGNTPNGDPVETAAWQKWLAGRYGSVAALAAAWSVTPEQLGGFDRVPLPAQADLAFTRYRNARAVRAIDYNLFAQEKFTEWVRYMVTAIHGAGSKQLVNVGQDEGGVNDRVLNHFYADGGVAFTTNHSYWQDDALLWDSVVAKRPGMPNIIGETGYQPVWATDGEWRYDELSGYGLLERKWALGFAAANSGILQWDWAREADFGMKRSDGSAKTWQAMMRDMGQFAGKAAPHATGLVQPQVAIVLPQSLQLSVLNSWSLEAQKKSVRALYHYARSEAYAVGEYQIGLLGNPKLIVLPSPFGLTEEAWKAIRGKVEAGATLLVSGRFDGDAHFHPTGRQKEIGLAYEPGPLTTRENLLKWPEGTARLTYSGDKTTYIDRAVLPDGGAWAEKALGKGLILFAALPLELNDNVQAVGDIYRYALKAAGVAATYSTSVEDPGILICPTRFPRATLYVLTSESNQQDVAFRDLRSKKQFSGTLEPGRAAMLLIADDGNVLASYNWKPR